MATSQVGRISLVSVADISAITNHGMGVTVDANGLAAIAGADGADFVGVLEHGGSGGAGVAQVSIATAGMSTRIRAGAAFNEGDMLTTDANGRFVQVDAANEIICAKALQAATALNNLVDALVMGGTPSASGAA